MRAKLAIAILLPLAAAACGGGDRVAVDHVDQHPIAVERSSRGTSFASEGDGRVHAPAGELRAFAQDYLRRGHGPVVVRGTAQDVGAMATALARVGVGPDAILVDAVAPHAAGGKVSLRFDAYSATPPTCGEFKSDRDSLFATPYNSASSEFGCSTRRNLGLMISDPSDLVRARGPESPLPSTLLGGRVEDYGKYERPAATEADSVE